MSKNKIIVFIVLLFSCTIGLIGCGHDQKTSGNTNSTVSRISLSPEEITLAPKGNYKFEAALYDANNNIVSTESVNWSVSGSIGQITASGTFTAVAVGEGRIIASAGSTQGTAKIVVADSPPPADFDITISSHEVISPSKEYAISWTAPKSDAGLKEYQVLGRYVNQSANFGVLMKKIDPASISATVDLLMDGTWEVKIRAIDNKGLWRDSDGTSAAGDKGVTSRILTINADSTPPLPFTLSYPWQDGQKIDSNDIKISWDQARDINLDHYEIAVGTNFNDIHSSQVYSATIEASASRECSLLNLPRGKYYICLVAYDKACHYRMLNGKTDIASFDDNLTSGWKANWPMFEIMTIPPSSFSLAEPYDGRRFDGIDVKIAWNDAFDTNLDRYELTVSTNEADVKGSAVFSGTFEVSTLREGVIKGLKRGIYYIAITAFDADGNWCDLKGTANVPEFSKSLLTSFPSFEIDPIPPYAFSISNIYNGKFFDTRNVKIAWNEADDRDLDRYELYVGKDKNNIVGSAVYVATIEAAASRESLVNLPGGIYWIDMRAYDKLGNFRELDGKTNAVRYDLDLPENMVWFEIDHNAPIIN